MRAGLLIATLVSLVPPAFAAGVTFDERLRAQERIERVYDAHRIWPGSNHAARPSFGSRVSREAIVERVERTLRESAALDQRWHDAITSADLQREVERMARGSRDPALLRELFRTLDDDARLIAECLARRSLVESRFAERFRTDGSLHAGDRPLPKSLEPGRDDGLALEGSGISIPTNPAMSADAWLASFTPAGDWRTPPSAPYAYRLPPVTGWGGADALEGHSPGVRTGDGAVWTGVEMLLWGGGGGDEPGWRYEPASDTWCPMAVDASTPVKRQGFVTVWTGSEMIVWGGGRTCGPYTFCYEAGGAYDPAADRWRAIAAGDQRSDPSAVWSGSEMIVFGGYYYMPPIGPLSPPYYGYYTDARAYDPASDSWRDLGSAPLVGRAGHSAVWTGREMVVWGGYRSSVCSQYQLCWQVLGDGARLDPATATWRTVSMTGAPSPRKSHAASWAASRMVIWGGLDGACTITSCNQLLYGDGARYDPVTDVWSPIAAAGAPAPRRAASVVSTGSTTIVWGGRDLYQPMISGGRYDPATDRWSPMTTLGAPLDSSGATAIWTGGEMIVWNLGVGGRYDPASDRWYPTEGAGAAPLPRRDPAVVWTGAEMIVWGGASVYLVFGSPVEYARDDGGRYDPATDSWSSVSSDPATPTARTRHTAVWTGTEVIVWGGIRDSVTISSGSRYDPALDRWTTMATSGATPEPRTGHTAVWTGAEMIVWGGSPWATTSGSGGRYDPATDTWQQTSLGAGVPESRYGHVAVWAGSQMLVWGGRGSTDLADGARYDPALDAWQPLPAVAAPASRLNASAVWSGTEMIVWGGESGFGSTLLDSGGRYDPALDRWAPTATAGAPAPRSEHRAVWSGGEMIVWGGSLLGTGGRYDPRTDAWRPVATAGAPTARLAHAAVWTGQEMLVWGGEGPVVGSEAIDGGRYEPTSDSWRDGPAPRGLDVLAAKGAGAAPVYGAGVRGYSVSGAATPTHCEAFPEYPGHGARVAAGDVDGGGDDELLAAPGPGSTSPPEVRGFDRDGQPVTGVDFFCYGAAGHGANVGSGTIDGAARILTGPGPSPVFGPHVRAFRFSAASVAPIAKVSFYAYGTLRYGVDVEATDLDGDGFAELVTGAGPGAVFGPHVRAFDYDGAAVAPIPSVSFFAFGTPRFGVEVAGGDLDGDGFGEIVAGPGPSPAFAPQLRGFDVDGGPVRPLAQINAFVFPGARYGLDVAAGDLETDGFDEIACGAGPDPQFGSRLACFDYDGAALAPIPALALDVYGLSYGIVVSAGDFGL